MTIEEAWDKVLRLIFNEDMDSKQAFLQVVGELVADLRQEPLVDSKCLVEAQKQRIAELEKQLERCREAVAVANRQLVREIENHDPNRD